MQMLPDTSQGPEAEQGAIGAVMSAMAEACRGMVDGMYTGEVLEGCRTT